MLIQTGIRAGVISFWPEAIQFFLRTYTTHNVITDADAAPQNIRQLSTEDELEYGGRQSATFSR